jgi:hypothetical protein
VLGHLSLPPYDLTLKPRPVINSSPQNINPDHGRYISPSSKYNLPLIMLQHTETLVVNCATNPLNIRSFCYRWRHWKSKPRSFTGFTPNFALILPGPHASNILLPTNWALCLPSTLLKKGWRCNRHLLGNCAAELWIFNRFCQDIIDVVQIQSYTYQC